MERRADRRAPRGQCDEQRRALPAQSHAGASRAHAERAPDAAASCGRRSTRLLRFPPVAASHAGGTRGARPCRRARHRPPARTAGQPSCPASAILRSSHPAMGRQTGTGLAGKASSERGCDCRRGHGRSGAARRAGEAGGERRYPAVRGPQCADRPAWLRTPWMRVNALNSKDLLPVDPKAPEPAAATSATRIWQWRRPPIELRAFLRRPLSWSPPRLT